MNDPRIWFGPKRIGWGYGPRTWEGWAVVGLLVLAAVLLKRGLSA
ncbi:MULTISPECIES: hypothetical protein [Sphingobium]|jgi:hypothetical protein|nr:MULTISPECIES: hypothetical protein [Sphingobium]WIA57035.1 hypothetical protein N6H05_04260 [Sphingobium sp. WTD-1]